MNAKQTYKWFLRSEVGAVCILIGAITFALLRFSNAEGNFQWFILAITLTNVILYIRRRKIESEHCKLCGYPLILRKHGGHEEEEYEDDNGGLCGNCYCGDRISQESIATKSA